MLKKLLVSAMGAATLIAAAPASAVEVGLELILLVDVSGSVSTTEYELQRNGYRDAFKSDAVQSAILGSQKGAIAVTYIEWSGEGQRSQRIGWTLLDTAAKAETFGDTIGGLTRAFGGSTAIQSAMFNSWQLFGTEVGQAGNGYESLRQVIDVSGDGADNDTTACDRSANPACGRDAAIAAGVDTINGLAILGESGLQTYYTNNVKSANGFVEVANDFADFAAAIERKLIKEIIPTPEPASLALVGLGLLGAGLARRRAQKA